MPILKIKTNVDIAPSNQSYLLGTISSAVADMLSKPERYVMITLEPSTAMLSGGSDAPLAYLELKSLGLPEDQTSQYSKKLCDLIGHQLGIDQDRIYIEFSSPARHLFGWDGRTF